MTAAIDMMEPGSKQFVEQLQRVDKVPSTEAVSLVSTAISLKRIADSLDRLERDGITVKLDNGLLIEVLSNIEMNIRRNR